MSHPYAKFENTELWKAIDSAMAHLEKNKDLKLETAREYVIGSLCQKLVRDSVAVPGSFSKT